MSAGLAIRTNFEENWSSIRIDETSSEKLPISLFSSAFWVLTKSTSTLTFVSFPASSEFFRTRKLGSQALLFDNLTPSEDELWQVNNAK